MLKGRQGGEVGGRGRGFGGVSRTCRATAFAYWGSSIEERDVETRTIDTVIIFVHRDGNGVYPPRLARCRRREYADRRYAPAPFMCYFQREQADKDRCARVL